MGIETLQDYTVFSIYFTLKKSGEVSVQIWGFIEGVVGAEINLWHIRIQTDGKQ